MKDCKAATRLMSKQLDTPLTSRERLTLRFHLLLCGACRRCEKQFQLLHRAGEHFNQAPPRNDKNDPPGSS
ncbi:zf-HC2 domain-containing protein [Halomonas binhaiensis]|uniref:Zf-HC2 domain-containing protein n=2 Tax=Halomonas binhaiensis TaxID=2562282 RepID=A0A5C1NCV5_9GAMM|nr:zf-HC2 domain-containing protein [Halomonas binhaiensis]